MPYKIQVEEYKGYEIVFDGSFYAISLENDLCSEFYYRSIEEAKIDIDFVEEMEEAERMKE